jgi:uncharacterized protein
MRVVLDSNVLLSALISPHGPPHRIYEAWRQRRFDLLTCPTQLDELRRASRYPKFRGILQPHRVGRMVKWAPRRCRARCAIGWVRDSRPGRRLASRPRRGGGGPVPRHRRQARRATRPRAGRQGAYPYRGRVLRRNLVIVGDSCLQARKVGARQEAAAAPVLRVVCRHPACCILHKGRLVGASQRWPASPLSPSPPQSFSAVIRARI